MKRQCLELTFFLAASRGGFTPFISRLFNSLDKNVFFRWMLMNPDEIVHIGGKELPLCVCSHTHQDLLTHISISRQHLFIPGPAISVFWMSSLSGIFCMIFSAISLGLIFIPFAFIICSVTNRRYRESKHLC